MDLLQSARTLDVDTLIDAYEAHVENGNCTPRDFLQQVAPYFYANNYNWTRICTCLVKLWHRIPFIDANLLFTTDWIDPITSLALEQRDRESYLLLARDLIDARAHFRIPGEINERVKYAIGLRSALTCIGKDQVDSALRAARD